MIGIFDSGIGGVTVLKEILKILPNYHYIYYSDSIHNPYGDKSKEELITIVYNVVNDLVNKGCKIVVIACNTASAICKDYLREQFCIPIIAIEPACKMVYDCSYNGNTLVLATKGTLESEKFLKLYHKYDNHRTTICECVGLADLIEQNKTLKIKKYLREHLGSFKNIQNVVLGCTHYPLITNEIKEVLGEVNFFDGSLGVAKRLKQVVNELRLEEVQTKVIFIDSSKSKEKEKRFWNILNTINLK